MPIFSHLFGRLKSLLLVDPQSNTGAVITGATIDRKGFLSALITILFAASSGTPDTATTKIELYHGDASNMSDEAEFVTDLEATLDIKSGAISIRAIDLSRMKRYFRIKIDPTYSGGTTPANVIGGTVVLGDAVVEPPQSQTLVE